MAVYSVGLSDSCRTVSDSVGIERGVQGSDRFMRNRLRLEGDIASRQALFVLRHTLSQDVSEGPETHMSQDSFQLSRHTMHSGYLSMY